MRGTRAWLLLCVLHGVASMLMWWAREPAVQALTWHADDWPSHAWTLWTSAWVHLNTPHLIGNQLALGALTATGWMRRPPLSAALAWALSWPLLQASLILWPQVGHAVGLSGLLHAGVAVLGLHLLMGAAPRGARPWGATLLGGLLFKVMLERGWYHPVVLNADTDLPVVQAAHLTGVVWGVLLGALSAFWARRAPGPATRP
ncbi:MAG: hypothetical protein IBJ14_09220 [Hydrogenophaga sp.]|nr:hypothetical protein [Hydrogenophaga sp.]